MTARVTRYTASPNLSRADISTCLNMSILRYVEAKSIEKDVKHENTAWGAFDEQILENTMKYDQKYILNNNGCKFAIVVFLR